MPASRADPGPDRRVGAGPSTGLVDAVRRDIIAGRLRPGTRITESSLAQRHGVSRVPVREALRGLEAEGFVESRPHVGSTVAQIPTDEADDLFAVREALEIATARRAAARARELFGTADRPQRWWSVRHELEQLLDDGDAAVRADDLAALVPLNDRFHLGVAELGGSQTLATLLRQLSGKIEWLYALDTFSRGKRLWPDHRLVLAAVDAGDETRAGELMGRHVRQARIGFLRRTDTAASADRLARLGTDPPVLG